MPAMLELDAKKGKTKKGNVHLFQEMILLTTNKGGKLAVAHKFPLAKTYCAIPATGMNINSQS